MASPTQIYRIQRKRKLRKAGRDRKVAVAKNGTTPSQKELFKTSSPRAPTVRPIEKSPHHQLRWCGFFAF